MKRYFEEELEYFAENKTESNLLSAIVKPVSSEIEKDYLVPNDDFYRVQRAKRRIIGYVKKQD